MPFILTTINANPILIVAKAFRIATPNDACRVVSNRLTAYVFQKAPKGSVLRSSFVGALRGSCVVRISHVQYDRKVNLNDIRTPKDQSTNVRGEWGQFVFSVQDVT